MLVFTNNSGLAGLGTGSRRTAKKKKLYSLVQIDLLKLCLVYPFCLLSLSPLPSVLQSIRSSLLVPTSLSSFRFTSFLLIYENCYNPNVISLLITSICLSVFCVPLVYITLATLPLQRMCVCQCGISVCIFCILFCEG